MKDEKQQKIKKSSPQKSASKNPVQSKAKPSIPVKPKTSPKTKTKPVGKSLPKSQKVLAERTPPMSLPAPPVRVPRNAVPKPQANPAPANRHKTKSRSSKKRFANRRFSRILRFLFWGLLLTIIISFAAVKFGNIMFSNVSDGLKGMYSLFSQGNGFPYSISETDINEIDMIGSNILVLNGDSAKVINSTAKETLSYQNIFSNAAADVRNGRAIVFDRASGRFKIQSRTGVLFEKDIEKNILTAAIGKKGNFAIASESKEAQSELTVFDKNKNRIFAWKCALERISSVSLSDNGKSAAVAVVGVKNGELYSKLLVFDFNKEEAVVSFDYPEAVLFKVNFTGKNVVIAVGDKLFSSVDLETEKKQDISFGADTLHRFCMHESGKTALVLASFGNTAKNELKVYGLRGELLFEKSIEEEIEWVACDNNYTSVLLKNGVQSFNKKGDMMGNISLESEAQRILVHGKKTYVVIEGEINQYTTVGKNQ